jgi:osmotically-inducible protein OsmY
MKLLKPYLQLLAVVVIGTMAACTTATTKSADVSDSISASLERAGFMDVSVSQDRTLGVVTLGGKVATEGDKMNAQSLAQSIAGSQVVKNEIAVIGPDSAKDDRQVNSDLDDGIKSNLNAALIQNKMLETVKFSVKNHVVTLTGEAVSQSARDRATEIAAAVPNVHQVVNEMQVKDQKASSTE